MIKLFITLKTTITQFLGLPKQNLYFDTVSGIALCIPGSYISKKSIYNFIISILPLIFLINQMEHRRSKLKWKRQSFIYTNIFPKVQNLMQKNTKWASSKNQKNCQSKPTKRVRKACNFNQIEKDILDMCYFITKLQYRKALTNTSKVVKVKINKIKSITVSLRFSPCKS